MGKCEWKQHRNCERNWWTKRERRGGSRLSGLQGMGGLCWWAGDIQEAFFWRKSSGLLFFLRSSGLVLWTVYVKSNQDDSDGIEQLQLLYQQWFKTTCTLQVKLSVDTPKLGWGGITHSDVGMLREIIEDDDMGMCKVTQHLIDIIMWLWYKYHSTIMKVAPYHVNFLVRLSNWMKQLPWFCSRFFCSTNLFCLGLRPLTRSNLKYYFIF